MARNDSANEVAVLVMFDQDLLCLFKFRVSGGSRRGAHYSCNACTTVLELRGLSSHNGLRNRCTMQAKRVHVIERDAPLQHWKRNLATGIHDGNRRVARKPPIGESSKLIVPS
jgi:hypothetical protein